ncbi:Nfu1 protein [Martiniozyma asiatica (nom. inval.)]|nr:Nfu1 protein [Martiniozyma asiatica]
MLLNNLKFIRSNGSLKHSVRFISLQTMTTPSENAMKFVATGHRFLPTGVTQAVEIENLVDAANKSPLAEELYKVNGVKSLLIGPNFITVNKVNNDLSNNSDLDWKHLQPLLTEKISKLMDDKMSVLRTDYMDKFQKELDALNENDDDIVYEIKELINTRIRPALQDDGGDVHFRSFDESNGIVYIKLKGACSSCSLSEETLKGGIEGMLKHYVPEVEEVRAVLDPEEEIAIQEFEKFEKKLKQNKA